MSAITEFVGATAPRSHHLGMSKKSLSPAELEASRVIADAVRLSERSQDDIAAEIGVSQGLIWQWANGRVPVPANRAVALAKALHLSPSAVSPAYAEIINSAPLGGLRPDEAALLTKYRLADDAGKRSLHAVGDALAQYLRPASNGN